MRYLFSSLAVVFALAHIAAALTQFKSGDPAARGSAVIMMCGGIAVAFSAIAHLAGGGLLHADALGAASGCVLVCFAAYLNGRRAGNVHIPHHVIRGAVAALLVAGIAVW